MFHSSKRCQKERQTVQHFKMKNFTWFTVGLVGVRLSVSAGGGAGRRAVSRPSIGNRCVVPTRCIISSFIAGSTTRVATTTVSLIPTSIRLVCAIRCCISGAIIMTPCSVSLVVVACFSSPPENTLVQRC